MEYPDEREPPNVITSDTENATTIQPDEAPPHKQAKFRRFRAYNTGTWNGPKRENKEVTRRQDNLHRFDSIASSLSLKSHQKERGRNILDGMNVREVGIRVDAIIFALCVLVANADVEDGNRYWVEDGTRYWPQPSSQREGGGRFVKIADSLDLDWKRQMSAIKKIQSEVDI